VFVLINKEFCDINPFQMSILKWLIDDLIIGM